MIVDSVGPKAVTERATAYFGMPLYSVLYPSDDNSVEHSVLACRIQPLR